MNIRFVFIFITFNLCLYSFPNIVKEIPVPEGFQRIDFPKNSFADYLQNLPLKKEAKVLSYQKKDLSDWYDMIAVINKPLLFQDDLEQCADFSMRLWADYHKESGRLDKLYLFDYPGKKRYYKDSKKDYNRFLRNAFASSNSYSLKKGAIPVTKENLQPGDLFVQNETGGIGHVSMILDEAKYKNQKLYLIGFSFMPAQEMHIERSPTDKGKEGWFSYEGFIQHLRTKYPYGNPVLRRF
ncbi:hypothetical protein LPTSP3_g24440 [Leptospira kobayashii]|uniref:Lipoprotein n=1 Tax=Leptospira kobayashii TaxID=1917830 RepID=A0ABM7USW8_9LEPT|nr:DUF4846 domain-containing protein [Leptospira kobayashii]BDA79514.1 hypothetical protein LPTSP3_g24440 [Leptospira kobayashii]